MTETVKPPLSSVVFPAKDSFNCGSFLLCFHSPEMRVNSSKISSPLNYCFFHSLLYPSTIPSHLATASFLQFSSVSRSETVVFVLSLNRPALLTPLLHNLKENVLNGLAVYSQSPSSVLSLKPWPANRAGSPNINRHLERPSPAPVLSYVPPYPSHPTVVNGSCMYICFCRNENKILG